MKRILGLAVAIILIAVMVAAFVVGKPGEKLPVQAAAPATSFPAIKNPFGDAPQFLPPPSAMEAALGQAVAQYRQASAYPPYSLPMNAVQLHAYNGNATTPVVMPLGNGDSLSISLNQLHFQQGEVIRAVVSVTGSMASASVGLSLVRAGSRDSLQQKTLPASATGQAEGELKADVPPGEYVVLASVDRQGDALSAAAPVVVDEAIGRVTAVGEPVVDGNDLVIPVSLTLGRGGDYLLSAGLYADAQVIAYLSAEETLPSGEQTLRLRANGMVLAGRGARPVLAVGDFLLRRMPARPGDITAFSYGPSSSQALVVPDLSRLKAVPYQDQETVERTAELEKISHAWHLP